MPYVDDQSAPRLRGMLAMVQKLSSAATPQEVLEIFALGMSQFMEPTAFLSLSCRDVEPGAYRVTRSVRPTTALHETGPILPETLPVHRGGLLGEVIARQHPAIIHHLDVPEDPVMGDELAPYRSLMAIPLYDQGRALNWAIYLRPGPDAFDLEEMEEALLRSNLVGGTVRHVQTSMRLRDASRRIHEEMRRIADIQRALLPTPMPSVPGLSLASSYRVFDAAGGDLYDVIKLSPIINDPSPRCGELWGLVVADVSGHGPSAAVVMAMLHAILHSGSGRMLNPATLMANANDQLHEKQIENAFTTAFLATYRTRSHDFVYANAGHHPPLLMEPGPARKIIALDKEGDLPLGIYRGVRYVPCRMKVAPGQTLLFYTDGVTEAMNAAGRQFGLDRLRDAMRASDGTAEGVIASVNSALEAHQGSQPPHDDQTMLAVTVL